MGKRERILLTLASAFLIVQSFNLLQFGYGFKTPLWWVEIIKAMLANLYITGIFAFVGFAYPTRKLLPAAYYEIRKPGRLKKWFQFLKVELFRKFLLASFWKNKKRRKQYFDGKAKGLEHFEAETQQAEFGHLWPFIILTGISLYALFKGRIVFALTTMLINVLFNFYPILLQRFHRLRISRVLQRPKV